MHSLNNESYYIDRCRNARELSARAASPAIADIHATMARRYEAIALDYRQNIRPGR